jgi:hypothetical protein
MQQRGRGAPKLRLVSGVGESGGETKGQKLTREIRRRVLDEAGLGECLQLCDAGQMEHVCDLVPEAFISAMHGQPPGLIHGLRENLQGPLSRYVPTLTVPRRPPGFGSGVRMELAPTLALIDAVEEVIRRIEVGPWDDASAADAKHLLRYAWCNWIVYVASYWMWAEVPILLASKALRREHGRLGKGVPRVGVERKTDRSSEIIQAAERLAKTMAAESVAGAVARHLGVSAHWVRRVLKKEREQKTKLKATL